MDAAATIHLIAFLPIFLRVSFLLFIGKEKLGRTDERSHRTLHREKCICTLLKVEAVRPTHFYFPSPP